jgi:hypothetical protein
MRDHSQTLADEGFVRRFSEQGPRQAKGSKVKPNAAINDPLRAGRGKRPRWFTWRWPAGKKIC